MCLDIDIRYHIVSEFLAGLISEIICDVKTAIRRLILQQQENLHVQININCY